MKRNKISRGSSENGHGVKQSASSGALRKAPPLPKAALLPQAASTSNKISRCSIENGIGARQAQAASSAVLRKAAPNPKTALLPKAASTSNTISCGSSEKGGGAKQAASSGNSRKAAPMLKAALLAEAPSTSNRKEANDLRSLGLSFAGFEECRQNVRDRMNDERFSANCGVSASTLYAELADLAVQTPRIKTKDFLTAVNELKLYLTEHVQAGCWDMDENTFHNRWKETVKVIAALKEKKIKFDPHQI